MYLFSNKFYIIFISIWIIGLYFFFFSTSHGSTPSEKYAEERISHLQTEVEYLRQKIQQIQSERVDPSGEARNTIQCHEIREELVRVKRQLSREKTGINTHNQNQPSTQYEQLRRKIESQTRELFYFAGDQMKKVASKLTDDDRVQWEHVIDRHSDQIKLLLASIRNLTDVDGYQEWREQEHKSLSKLMQARLQSLQGPSKPCSEIKRMTCNINKGCGYGCEIHHAMHCFHIAYALGRPLILISDGWRYNPGGFDEIFLPLTENCTKVHAAGAASWSNYEKADVVEIPLIDNIQPRKDFLPMAIPDDIADRLIRLHGNPFVWFTGQLMKYMLRPRPWLIEFMEKKYQAIDFRSPIVGVHVRRTDKVGTEAAFHDIAEYMKHVEDFYIIYQYQYPTIRFEKRVFLATDDPSVFADARSKFPKYKFLGDADVAKSAQVNTRYGTESLKGVLLDIHFLSLCDYLVCTFSSQICRVAYEVMQQRVADGAWRVQPMDDVYYFGGQNAHNQRAIVGHKAIWPNEFSFDRNDLIGTEGNHWDGFSKGSDKTNGQSGLYPSYKVEEIVNVAKMYTYPDVPEPGLEA